MAEAAETIEERIATILAGASWSHLVQEPTHVNFDEDGNARIWRDKELLATISYEVFERPEPD